MDTIYPVHSFDASGTNEKFGVLVCLQFEVALDPARLEDSLNKLLTSDEDWLKWAGRLRRDKNRKLELHVPSTFTAARPPARFSLADYPCSLAENPVVDLLPRQTEDISIYQDPEQYRWLYQSKEVPQSLAGYLTTDEPVLAVHVSRFSDATFIGISFPHVLSDASGLSLLLNAWADVLAEKPIPKVVSHKEDRMAQVYSDSKDRHSVGIVESFALSWWKEIVFVFWMLVGILLQRKVETLDIYVPAKVIRRWREEALAELPGVWLSESDILTAWLIQHRMSNLQRGVSLWIVADVRKRLPQVPANYPGNAVMPLMVPLLNRSQDKLSAIAQKIREAIATQGTPEELVKEIQFIYKSREKRGRDGVIAVPGTEPYICTNWTRARLFTVNFEGALIGPAVGPAFPTSGATLGFAELPIRNICVIVGKDVKGGYLMQCQVPSSQLQRFRAAVLASGET